MGSNDKHRTLSGYELKSCYGPGDLAGFEFDRKLGAPGAYPFTRGIRQNMYRDSLWVMGQYSGFASAEEANKRYRYLIEQGQTGFSIALDLPTQMGIDSDAPIAEGEVGKTGVAIDSLADIETLFEGIQLEKVRQIRTTANANSIIMLGYYVAFARKHGIDPNKIGFFLQNDCLKEYICRGTYIFPPAASDKLAADVIEYTAKHLPNWTPIAVSGYHIREAGATAAQEIAFTLSNMIAYMDAARGRGVAIDACARNIYFFLAAQVDFLEEVAKFRAARRVYAKIMRERYGAQDPETQRLKIFVFTCGSALTAEQPLNNVVRVTLETMAAVAGGCQTLATSSFDEAFSIPTEEAVTVALRTQQIVAYESGITQTVDILGGSYACEALTDRIEVEIWGMLDEIEKRGGAVKCIEEGYFQRILSDGAYRLQKSVDDGERVIVGVNKFRDDKVPEIPTFKLSNETGKKQSEKLARLRESRDNIRVQRALDAVRAAAGNGDNLGDAMIEACDAYATMGEICDVLKEVYGKYMPLKIY
jgi:methylmalonyl-CoA mutase N-terminal domain/subunit